LLNVNRGSCCQILEFSDPSARKNVIFGDADLDSGLGLVNWAADMWTLI
jgi:hypothetical protein